jgi:hypothetical protein
MRDYCYINVDWVWKLKCNPRIIGIILQKVIKSNLKRQMTKEEGLLFVQLMKKTYTHKQRKEKRWKMKLG